MRDEAEYAPNLDVVLDKLAEAPRYNAWLFDRARPHLGAGVLDAGAGTGTFTELAANAAREVVAIEPDAQFAELLRGRFSSRSNVRVVQADLEDLGGVEGGFDSVVCFNVLEHVRDDARALAQLAERLAPGGRLLLLVPAHPVLYGPTDRAIGHVRRYRKGALRGLLERAGYEVEQLRHVNPAGALWWLVSARWPRSEQMPFAPLSTADRVVPLLRPLDALRLPFGLSLWAVGVRR